MARVRAERRDTPAWATGSGHPVVDPVPACTPGATEIGFAGARALQRVVAPVRQPARRTRTRSPLRVRRCAPHVPRALRARRSRREWPAGVRARARRPRADAARRSSRIRRGDLRCACARASCRCCVNTLSPPELVAYYLQDSGARSGVRRRLASPTCWRTTTSRRVDCATWCTSATWPRRARPRSHWRAPRLGAWVRRCEPRARARRHASRRDGVLDVQLRLDRPAQGRGAPASRRAVHVSSPMAATCSASGADDVVFSPPKIFFAYGFGNSAHVPVRGRRDHRADARAPRAGGRVRARSSGIGPPSSSDCRRCTSRWSRTRDREARDLSSVRLCLSAAETLSTELFQEWRGATGCAIVEGLGSTEVLHIYLSNTPGLQKPGASGKRVPGYELRLTRSRRQRGARPAAPACCGCAATRRRRATGTARTRPRRRCARAGSTPATASGDDEDGYHFFEGRADDLVKVSGQWVHPLEVERCLAEHPFDPRMRGARRRGREPVDDARRVRRAARCVARGRRRPPRSCRRFVKERLLPYKYPRLVRYLAELPKTGTGKIDRQALRRAR